MLKKIIYNPFVNLFPVLILFFRGSLSGFVVPAVIYIGLCSLLCMKSNKDFDLNQKNYFDLIVSVIFDIFFGYLFFKNWVPSSAFESIAGFFHIRSTIFIFAVTAVIVILSFFGIYRFISSLNRFSVKKDNRIVYKEKASLNIKDVFFALGLAVFIGCFALFRPLGEYRINTDEAVFMYIGKYMHNGLIPYKDLFDHKGLLLYIIQYLGFSISYNTLWGIWIVCVADFFAFILIITKTLKLFTEKTTSVYITEFVCCFLFRENLGKILNLTEGLALPWTALALYVSLKYFITDNYKFRDVVFLGISFGAVFALRCNMIGVFATVIPIIFIHIIINKRWKDIWKCAVGFVAGFSIICIPLIIYLIATDSWNKMIEYYFEFNFVYTAGEDISTGRIGIIATSLRFISKFAVLIVPFFSVFSTYKRDKIYWISFLSFIVSVLFASVSGRDYPHYAFVAFPSAVVMVMYFTDSFIRYIKAALKKEKIIKFVSAVIIAILSVTSVWISKPIKAQEKISEEYYWSDDVCNYLSEKTSENDDVLIIGNYVQYYLYSGRKTTNRFFYQTPPANENDIILDEVKEEILINKPDFILVPDTYEKNMKKTGRYLQLLKFIDTVDGYKMCKNNSFYVYEKIR